MIEQNKRDIRTNNIFLAFLVFGLIIQGACIVMAFLSK